MREYHVTCQSPCPEAERGARSVLEEEIQQQELAKILKIIVENPDSVPAEIKTEKLQVDISILFKHNKLELLLAFFFFLPYFTF
ncbi:hypothetical protein C0J52_16912 [Blattella germanica]|nr:hypothetical protein C0J52_16912 [Blattella germanica]